MSVTYLSEVPFLRFETDLVNDPECKLGVAVWVAGCSNRCEGCQNVALRNPDTGTPTTLEEIMNSLCQANVGHSPLWESIIFLGGDWMEYPQEYEWLVASVWEDLALDAVLYTGKVFEKLPAYVRDLTEWIIDGPYDKDQKGIYPASYNQRVFHNGEQVDPTTLPLYKRLAGKE